MLHLLHVESSLKKTMAKKRCGTGHEEISRPKEFATLAPAQWHCSRFVNDERSTCLMALQTPISLQSTTLPTPRQTPPRTCIKSQTSLHFTPLYFPPLSTANLFNSSNVTPSSAL